MINKIIRIKRKCLLTLMSLFTVAFLIADILVRFKALPYIHYVRSDYNYYIFDAIITLSTLCFTILSIIISVSSDKFYGIKLSDIMSFKSLQNNRQQMLITLLCFDVIAIFLLGFELTMALTTLAIIVISYCMYSIVFILGLLYNESFVKECIELELKDGAIAKDTKHLDNWMCELKHAIENKNTEEIERFASYLAILTTKDKLEEIYYSKVHNIFVLACHSIGIPDSIKYVLRLNKPEVDYYYQDEIYRFINSFKTKDCEYLNELNITGVIRSIIECDILSVDEKSFCLYQLFVAIYDNVIINEAYKNSSVKTILKELCTFYSGDMGKSQFNVLLGIFRDYILLREDNAEELYCDLITELEKSNHGFEKEYLPKLIAHIVRALYFYYSYEDTIGESKKKQIKDMINAEILNIEGMNLSIKHLALENSNEITKELIYDAIYGKAYGDMMEYFSSFSYVKNIVWDRKNKFIFSLVFHVVFDNDYKKFPCNIIDANKLDSSYLGMFSSFKNMFEIGDDEENLYEYSTFAKKQFENLQDLFDMDGDIENYYNEQVFEEINLIMDIIQSKECVENEYPEISQIEELLSDKLKDQEDIYVVDSLSEDKEEHEFAIPKSFVKKNANAVMVSASHLSNCVINAVNEIITSTFEKLYFTFDEEGIENLYDKLQNFQNGLCNYFVTKDYAFIKYREDESFKNLERVFETFKYCSWKNLYCSFIINKPIIEYSYSADIDQTDLTESEALEYIENWKVSSNSYCIDGVHRSKDKALEYVKKNYFILTGKLRIQTNLDKNDGYILKVDRTRRKIKTDENKEYDKEN